MIKLITLIVFLMNLENTNPQSLKLGGSLDFMLGNENLSIEIGPAINLEYLLDAVPVSINGCARLHYSELNDNTYKFSWGYSYTVYSIGAVIKYYPIRWDIEPYIGCGLFYNFNNSNASGMPSLINGYLISPNIDENNFSAEISGGIIFSAMSPINFILEVTQALNRPQYDLAHYDYEGKLISSEEKNFNFNALLIKLGVRFGL